MILLDPRAGSGHLIAHPPLDSLATHTELRAGDAAFIGRGPDRQVAVGVEVKSVADLLSSIQTGRLQGTQIPRMREEYDVVWLLVHGRWRVGADGGLLVYNERRCHWFNHPPEGHQFTYAYPEKWLMTAVESGVRVRMVEREEEVAAWLGLLAGWWEKRWERHGGMCAFDRSREIPGVVGMENGGMLRAQVANCLPKLGVKRARAAAEHFPSVRGMINAGVEEWCEVEGVGKGIGERIVEAVR